MAEMRYTKTNNPEETFDMYYDDIKCRVVCDGYEPRTSMRKLISNVVEQFDCCDNYGEYDPLRGYGGYGDSFTLDECFRYVEESGGWREFDWED